MLHKSLAGIAAALALAATAGSGAPPRVPAAAPASSAPVVVAAAAEETRLTTDHFVVSWDARRLTREQAEEASRTAEQAWERCRQVFGGAPEGRIRLDLSPDFRGATGFARRGDASSRDPDKQPLIGIRYADLEYLGLTGDYVITHEVGHIFSGELAPSSLGEGVADWAAGQFSGIPMRPWWGAALREGGLWIDPEAFFITGEFPAQPEVDEVIRTAQYVQSGLLVQFLAQRYGWEKFRVFALEYGRVRGRLNSNEDRRAVRVPRRFRPTEERPDPRVPPDAAAVRAVFQRHFGESWERLLSDWEAAMRADTPPAGQAERLVLGQRLYGSVRNWEMWVLEQKPPPDRSAQDAVREAFTRANRLLAAGDPRAAAEAYQDARRLVEAVRRPRIIT